MTDPAPNSRNQEIGDADVIRRIDELVEEEHLLEREHAGTGLDDHGRARLRELEVQLDQAWDLLRQRRARRLAGLDADHAQTRAPEVVERYQQ